MAAGDVFVHLFEWKWTDIATECEQVLGPAGYRAVQISPPQEHAIVAGNPWWQRYQPVSYSLERGRSGTRPEFVAMVSRCKAVDVDIYVDAVINHMTAGSGIGSNGTAYTRYSYPPLYSANDFGSGCGVNNFQSAANVQDCELLGLADLRTGQLSTQEKIADYLVGLSRLGVAGYRVDAAKHIQQVELNQIVNRVNSTLVADGLPRPYWFLEVIDFGGEAVAAGDYFGVAFASGGAADITEFRFIRAGEAFTGSNGQRLVNLQSMSSWGLMPADKAVVFLENHDTQRNGGISYRDRQTFRLANVWLLAQPFGYPSVMSSYAFERGFQAGRDAGPPSTGAGVTNDVSCASSLETVTPGSWVCEHRDPVIRRMVGFRRQVAGVDVNRPWTNGANAIAFSRGAAGFVAINREGNAVTASVETGLPAGSYCDLVSGDRGASGCTGATITVAANGTIALTLQANTAIALHVGARP